MAIHREEIRKLWSEGRVDALARMLAERRSEWSAWSVDRVRSLSAAAALGILTLVEMGSGPGDPLVREMGAALLAAQDSLGGWENPWTTSLVLRALSAGEIDGAAFARGLAYLASTQEATGGWAGSDSAGLHDTAFVLTMLGDLADFRSAVDVGRAVDWYEAVQLAPSASRANGVVDAALRQWTVALQRVGRVTGPTVH